MFIRKSPGAPPITTKPKAPPPPPPPRPSPLGYQAAIIKWGNTRVQGMDTPEKGAGTWTDIAMRYLLGQRYDMALYAAAKADIEKQTGREQPFGDEII